MGALAERWGTDGSYIAYLLTVRSDPPVMHSPGLHGWARGWELTACHKPLFKYADDDHMRRGVGYPQWEARLPVGLARKIARPCGQCVSVVGPLDGPSPEPVVTAPKSATAPASSRDWAPASSRDWAKAEDYGRMELTERLKSGRRYRCPCGWTGTTHGGNAAWHARTCPQARDPEPEGVADAS